MNDYTAASIRVLNEEEICKRWFWAEAGLLSIQYNRPELWIKRGLLACQNAGVPHDYFVDKYLRGLAINRHAGVDAAMRELLINERYSTVKE